MTEVIKQAAGGSGSQGPKGDKGDPGDVGPAGPQGIRGIPGPAGQDGNDGADGSNGAPGAQGAQGPQGIPGNNGTNGTDGSPGATGPAGPQGVKGDTGAQGVKGDTGNTGPQGPAGTTDWAGITNKPATFTPSSHSHLKADVTDFAHTHTKAEVGLGNVDNTADANKPISSAGQSALNGKSDTNHTHATLPSTAYAGLANGATAMALGTNGTVKVTPTATATYTTTVPPAGTRCQIIILTSGVSSFTITFGTGFKATGTLATGATSARVFVISFVSDGTNLYETGRTAAMVA